MVAKVDEENAAMISYTMDPAGDADIGADIRLAEGCTGVAAVTMHDFNPGLMLWNGFYGVQSTAADRMENRREKRMCAPICQGCNG
jgi:hypothetical protein